MLQVKLLDHFLDYVFQLLAAWYYYDSVIPADDNNS